MSILECAFMLGNETEWVRRFGLRVEKGLSHRTHSHAGLGQFWGSKLHHSKV